MDFFLGETVTWKHVTGRVQFICDDYITICIREWERDADETIHARRKKDSCCILCFRQYWSEVNKLQEK